MNVILLGPPGAGKGTQAAGIAESLGGVPRVSSGDLFRDHQRRDTELGRLARSYMERGVYVPDDVPRIFPNPFIDQLNITFTDLVAQNVTFELFDYSGRIVFTHEEWINNVFVTLDVGQLIPSTYFLSIKIGDDKEKVFRVLGGF